MNLAFETHQTEMLKYLAEIFSREKARMPKE